MRQSQLSGATPAAGDPFGYHTAFDSTARVVYRGTDGHVHELSYTTAGGWGAADLSAIAGGAAPASQPVAYVTPFDATARVVYRADDEHIHELWYTTANGWGHADLSQLSGAAPAAGEPYGYATTFDSIARVVYRGTDNHVRELYYTAAGGWGAADLTP